ncbi:hypothetical protein NQD34_009980 [Periophthalmus magnuspinnatus]|nr:hypothetical protein NQD34_009980 [Periophthalmus magnuspinnatus]
MTLRAHARPAHLKNDDKPPKTPVANANVQQVYPIFESSPVNPNFRKPIFKVKDNNSLQPGASPSVDVNAKPSTSTIEDKMDTATDTVKIQNGGLTEVD